MNLLLPLLLGGVYAALPPLGTVVYISPSTSKLDQAIRHCNYFASFDPFEGGNDDFSFRLVAALNGAPAPAYSFQSVNFPTMYVSYKATGLPSGMRVGIEESPDKNTASWAVAPTGASYTLTTLSQVPSLAGKVLSVAGTHSGPCNNEREKPDAVLLTAASGSPSQAFAIGAPPSPAGDHSLMLLSSPQLASMGSVGCQLKCHTRAL